MDPEVSLTLEDLTTFLTYELFLVFVQINVFPEIPEPLEAF
jgi:hypothetical protein